MDYPSAIMGEAYLGNLVLGNPGFGPTTAFEAEHDCWDDDIDYTTIWVADSDVITSWSPDTDAATAWARREPVSCD